jgi:hypothetical protein
MGRQAEMVVSIHREVGEKLLVQYQKSLDMLQGLLV